MCNQANVQVVCTGQQPACWHAVPVGHPRKHGHTGCPPPVHNITLTTAAKTNSTIILKTKTNENKKQWNFFIYPKMQIKKQCKEVYRSMANSKSYGTYVSFEKLANNNQQFGKSFRLDILKCKDKSACRLRGTIELLLWLLKALVG